MAERVGISAISIATFVNTIMADCTSDLPPGAAERSISQKAAIPVDGRDGHWRAFPTSDRIPPVFNVF
jgi:hypothetical protein